jgi:hypothetical protein
MLAEMELDLSLFAGIVQEIKQLLSSRCNMELVCLSRVQNNVSHVLANFGRTQAQSQTWPGPGPVNIPGVLMHERGEEVNYFLLFVDGPQAAYRS